MKAAQKMVLEKLLTITNEKTAVDKYQWALDGIAANYFPVTMARLKLYTGIISFIIYPAMDLLNY